jgi:hypothetical protein
MEKNKDVIVVKNIKGIETKYTNEHGLPAEVVSALTRDYYTVEGEKLGDYSASTLVSPVQKTTLEKRYQAINGKLKIFDVIDQFWAFLGSVSHQVLETAWHASMESIVEERFYMKTLGRVVSGKLDVYAEGLEQIRDYKTCKVYKILKGDFSDWEKQLNIYAQLLRENKKPVKEIKIIAMITDWKKGEARYKSNYPPAPIAIIPIRLWSEKEAKAYINHRVKSLKAAELLSDAEIAVQFPCTNKERWKDLKDWAIIKNGVDDDGRATKSCSSNQVHRLVLSRSNLYSMANRTRRRQWGKVRTGKPILKDTFGTNRLRRRTLKH